MRNAHFPLQLGDSISDQVPQIEILSRCVIVSFHSGLLKVMYVWVVRARWLLIGAILFVLAFSVWSLLPRNSEQEAFYLLTPDEMAELDNQPKITESLDRGLTVTQSDGPFVNFNSPKKDIVQSPVNIDVDISPRGDTAVDLSSIRIDYRMGPAWINVTKRIMKHASVEGSRLLARSAELPIGRHTMRLSIQDEDKRRTRVTVSFVVQ